MVFLKEAREKQVDWLPPWSPSTESTATTVATTIVTDEDLWSDDDEWESESQELDETNQRLHEHVMRLYEEIMMNMDQVKKELVLVEKMEDDAEFVDHEVTAQATKNITMIQERADFYYDEEDELYLDENNFELFDAMMDLYEEILCHDADQDCVEQASRKELILVERMEEAADFCMENDFYDVGMEQPCDKNQQLHREMVRVYEEIMSDDEVESMKELNLVERMEDGADFCMENEFVDCNSVYKMQRRLQQLEHERSEMIEVCLGMVKRFRAAQEAEMETWKAEQWK